MDKAIRPWRPAENGNTAATATGKRENMLQAVPGKEANAQQYSEKPLDIFEVHECKAFKKGPVWTVNLTDSQAVFICREADKSFTVARERAREEIAFQAQGAFTAESAVACVHGVSLNFADNKKRLEKWFLALSAKDMEKDLKGWGIGMIVMGAASIIFSSLLDPVWGGVIIGLGILNLLIKKRGMFIANGITLIVAGLFNSFGTFAAMASSGGGFKFFIFYGIMQIGWGVQEIRKYAKYANAWQGIPAQRIEAPRSRDALAVPVTHAGCILGIAGEYAGAEFNMDNAEVIVLGRDASVCNILFDSGGRDIGGKHCGIRYDAGKGYRVTDYSGSGTFTADGKRLRKDKSTALKPGSVICVGSWQNRFKLI